MHAAKTRPLSAGTILGAGTISNRAADGGPGLPIGRGGLGYTCIAEQRTVETILEGKPSTQFLKFGDVVRIEMNDSAGLRFSVLLNRRLCSIGAKSRRHFCASSSIRNKEPRMLNCENSFWRFSLAVYAEPNVAAECLALQTSLNINVNALLFCAWLGSERQTSLTDENLSALDMCAWRWHSTVVEPLRAVRQTMKPLPEMTDAAVQMLRTDIARLELRAEQIEQAMLFDLAAGFNHDTVALSAQEAIRLNVTALLQRNIACAGLEGVQHPKPERLIAAATAYPGQKHQ